MTTGKQMSKRPPEIPLLREALRIDAGSGQQHPLEAVTMLARWSTRYGLDIWAAHVCFMYGKPYVQAEGAIAWCRQIPEYQGFRVGPMLPERKAAEGIPETAIAFVCDVYMRGYRAAVQDIGVVTQQEIANAMAKAGDKAGYLPIVATPYKMARTRAIRRAHLRARPLTSAEDATAQLDMDRSGPGPVVAESMTDVEAQDAQESLWGPEEKPTGQ